MRRNFLLPAESDRLFVIEEFDPPPVSIYSEDFKMGQGSWEGGPEGGFRRRRGPALILMPSGIEWANSKVIDRSDGPRGG
jgi:hypothetical protein